MHRDSGGTPFYRRWWFVLLLLVLVWVVAFTLGRDYGRREKQTQTVVYTEKTRPPEQSEAPAAERSAPETARPAPSHWLDLVPSPPPLS